MRLALVALVAALSVGAYAAVGQDECICRHDVRCFTSLEQCEAGNTPYVFEETNAKICETTPVSTPIFSCWETPDICRFVSNCTIPPPDQKCQCRKDIKCFNTLRECRDFSGPTTFANGNNEECAAIDKPVYACWEEPEICRSTETCEVIPDGGGNQDPHFLGFDGSEYYFDGLAGQDYNIISDVNMQLNAHFIRLNQLKGTYMGRIGLRFGEHSLTFDPHFGVFFNNTLMTTGEIETSEGSFVVEEVDDRLRLVFQNAVYHITARVIVEKGEREEAYVNIHTALLTNPEQMPHGILGQTVARAITDAAGNATPFMIEGAEEDYHVRDGILGTDFTFNRFTGAGAEPVTASGSRMRRAPLFEATAH